ncbi:hypothetical protein GCM10011374_38900 [Kocuria dechangensis]|uniref:Uncharacterized protein n=1 Tax=Kocuria dechangensis TaxID=1176249 RepID=A0A917H874_9MICC|nr:hypothetical protein GCM10011374_38900 [Kocuria dechangensis]
MAPMAIAATRRRHVMPNIAPPSTGLPERPDTEEVAACNRDGAFPPGAEPESSSPARPLLHHSDCLPPRVATRCEAQIPIVIRQQRDRNHTVILAAAVPVVPTHGRAAP